MAVNGNTIIVQADTYEIGSQRGAVFESTAEMLDISDKTSNGAKFATGKIKNTVSCPSFYVVSDDAQASLRSKYESGSYVFLRWYEGVTDGTDGTGASLRYGTAYVTSLSVSAPEHGPAETEVTFEMVDTGARQWTDGP